MQYFTIYRDEKDGETSNEPTEAMETEAVESATKTSDEDREKPKEESKKRSIEVIYIHKIIIYKQSNISFL